MKTPLASQLRLPSNTSSWHLSRSLISALMAWRPLDLLRFSIELTSLKETQKHEPSEYTANITSNNVMATKQ